MSVHPPKIAENRCLLSLLAALMTHFSHSLFRLPVPTVRQPLYQCGKRLQHTWLYALE